METYQALTPAELERFVQRTKASSALPAEPDLSEVLLQILQKAGELVPSEAGGILLDDPLEKVEERSRNALHFVACFGPMCEGLLGETLPATEGVAGYVYRTGCAHVMADEEDRDPAFATRLDEATGHGTRSIVAAPIRIGNTVCGAIELVNRLDGGCYGQDDMLLLEVFASYAASTLQNVLDARHAQELAKVDDLTGLYNDRYLHVRLREELVLAREGGTPCALIFLDLDRFKPINDRHGHLVGSQVLRELGYLLRRATAGEDAILARYGGDEFTVVLPGRGLDQAVALGERIRRAIARAEFLSRSHGPDLPALHIRGQVTASLGVAAVEPETSRRGRAGENLSKRLIRLADQAMYAAKAVGGNRLARAELSGDFRLSAPGDAA